MRENSGQGDSENNLRDPTLKEHEDEKGERPEQPVPGTGTVIAAGEDDEQTSPSDRERGEGASTDEALATDIADGS